MSSVPFLGLLAAESLTAKEILQCRTFWGLVLAAVGLWLALPRRVAHGKTLGGVLGIVGLALVASDWPLLPNPTDQAVFWLLAGVTILAAGGPGSVTLTTTDGCAWTAVSNVPWAAITSETTGTASATIQFAVQANGTGAPRSGTLTIGGQTFTISQE